MSSETYQFKPHYVSGFTGHCPKYEFSKRKHGQLHKYEVSEMKKHVPKTTENSIDSVPQEDQNLTFCEIDYVIDHERDPEFVPKTEPGPKYFLPYLNDQLGPKPRQDGQYVADRHRQIEQTSQREKDNVRLSVWQEDKSKLESKKQLKCLKPFRTRDTFEEYRIKEVATDDSSVERKPPELCKNRQMTPNEKFNTERAPIFDIYKQKSGLIPNYAGHVPGSHFRFGATFGSDSFNAKQWLKPTMTRKF